MAGTNKKPVAKSVAKKKMVKKVAAKKINKKAIKKVAKKVTAKKQTPNINATTKKTAKKTTKNVTKKTTSTKKKNNKLPKVSKTVYPTEISDETKKKLEIIDKTFAKNKKAADQSKQVKVTSSEKNEAQKVGIRKQMSLVALSPYRFPAIRYVSADSFARIAGLAFIVAGALLTAFNFSLLNEDSAISRLTKTHHVAQVLEVINTTTNNEVIQEPAEPLPDPKPEVHFDVTDTNGIIAGETKVYMNVPYAQKVELLIKGKENGSLLRIGFATKQTSDTWSMSFNSAQFADGEYRFFANVTNQYGNYTSDSINRYFIENTPDTTLNEQTTGTGGIIETQTTPQEPMTTTSNNTTQTTETQTSTPDISSTADDTAPTIQVEFDGTEPLHDSVRFKVFVNNANSVKMYAVLPSASQQYLGYATKNNDSEWRFTWDTTKYPNGEYALFVKATVSGVTHSSDRKFIDVFNPKDGTVQPVVNTEASTTEELQNNVNPDTKDTSLLEDGTFNTDTTFKLSKSNPLSGFVEVEINSKYTKKTELYLIPTGSLTKKYIGTPLAVSDTRWKYVWDTKNTPNGDYDLIVTIYTTYGQQESKKFRVTIKNSIDKPLTTEQEAEIDKITDTSKDLLRITTDPTISDSQVNNDSDDGERDDAVISDNQLVYVEPVKTFVNTLDVEEGDTDSLNKIEELLNDFRSELNSYHDSYARALRYNNTDEVERIKRKIEELKQDVIGKLPSSTDKKELIDEINAYLSKITHELEQLIVKNEKIINERVGDAATRDSDADGITDFDEVNLYKTNPYVADSDGDGSLDGDEISLGYDPLDSKREALVAFESAKETGIVREDVLVIEAVTTIEETDEEETGSENQVVERKPKALISGKALPNSFVTLYIYSTPIVVTVRTDDSGRWSYVFDKELEDGEHEVYVGITDNEGKIVAKSAPFTFVKTAEAFEDTNPFAGSTFEDITPSFISMQAMLVIASIAVVALGLVLLILGLFASDKKYPQQINELGVNA